VGGERIVDFGLNPPEIVLRQLGSLLVSTKDKIDPAALERIEGRGSGVPHQFDELEGELESLRFDYLDGSVGKYGHDLPLRLSKLLWRLSLRFRQLVWPLRHEHSVDDRETDVAPSGRFRNCNKTADSGNTLLIFGRS
jgi:hypothetical protein